MKNRFPSGLFILFLICSIVAIIIILTARGKSKTGNKFDELGEKIVMVTYIPGFGRSGSWHNWEYLKAWEYGGEDSRPDTILQNGRRQIASVFYPGIGAYDSTDTDVLEYHVDIIKAMGIDVIQINYYADLEEDYLKTTEALIRLAEKKKIRVSFLYEPKIHMFNWIAHNSREERILAIAQDIVHIFERYGKSVAIFKLGDRTVISLFGANWIGLENSEWDRIQHYVREKGYDPVYIGDNASDSYLKNSGFFSGMFHWELYQDEIAFADETEIYTFCRKINRYPLQWKTKSEGRIPVGIVYPGFNDAKIWGWDTGRQRIINLNWKNSYEQSIKAVLDNKDQYDLVLVATFNDWNESTHIEPDMENGYERAIMTQNFIEDFKGIQPLNDNTMQEITEKYLSRKNTVKYK